MTTPPKVSSVAAAPVVLIVYCARTIFQATGLSSADDPKLVHHEPKGEL